MPRPRNKEFKDLLNCIKCERKFTKTLPYYSNGKCEICYERSRKKYKAEKQKIYDARKTQFASDIRILT